MAPLAAGLVAVFIVVPAPASAQRITVTDEAGDTLDPGLDITSVVFKNRDRGVVATFEVVRDRRARSSWRFVLAVAPLSESSASIRYGDPTRPSWSD